MNEVKQNFFIYAIENVNTDKIYIGVTLSPQEAADKLNISRSGIYVAVRNNGSSGGYQWKYWEKNFQEKISACNNNRYLKNKKVSKFSKNGKFLEEYENVYIAGEENNVKDYQCIIKVCDNQRKTTYGFKWEWS